MSINRTKCGVSIERNIVNKKGVKFSVTFMDKLLKHSKSKKPNTKTT